MAVTEQPGRGDAKTDDKVSSSQIKPVVQTTEEESGLSPSQPSLSPSGCAVLQGNENHSKKCKLMTTATLIAADRIY